MRARYREQWLADLADAGEAGMRPTQIAIGALAFVATYDRPLRVRAVNLQRRSRLASGLSLSAALVAVSMYASIVSAGGLTGNGVYDYASFIASALLVVYVVLAPLVAVVIVSVTRGISYRVRLAVWLLAAACLSPIAHGAIDSTLSSWDNIYLTPGATGYVVGALFIVVAAFLLWREFSPATRPTAKSRGFVSAAAVITVGALGLAYVANLWFARSPLRPSTAGLEEHEYLTPEWFANEAAAERWVSGTWLATAVFVAAVAMILAAARFAARPTVFASTWFALGVGFAVMIILAALFSFVDLMLSLFDSSFYAGALSTIGRWGLVFTVLFSLGGLRLARRPAEASVPVRR
jgi:hypothetical protein